MSRTLGATLSANNCSTAHFFQSRTFERIIELSIVNGITDKAKLIHYFGNWNNHMQKKWGNTIAIGFGRRLGEAMADELLAFAPHLQITDELMNVHR